MGPEVEAGPSRRGRIEAPPEGWGYDLIRFVAESNRIEGITRKPTAAEIREHHEFLEIEQPAVDHLVRFVGVVAPGKLLRTTEGMNVRVGSHLPVPGGPHVLTFLEKLLDEIHSGGHSAYSAHRLYERLHPFMDGNGRSGRVLWLWMMLHHHEDPYALPRGFLHTFYYQALAEGR